MGTFIGLLVLIGILIGDGERAERVAARELAAETTLRDAELPVRPTCGDEGPHLRDLTIPYANWLMPEGSDD